MSDTRAYQLQIRALLITTTHFCEVVVPVGPLGSSSSQHRRTPSSPVLGSAPSAASRWICQQPREGSSPARTSSRVLSRARQLCLRLQNRQQPCWSPHRLRHGPSASCLGAQPRLPLRYLSSSSWSPFHPFNETSQARFAGCLGHRRRRGCRCRHPPRAPFDCVQRTENARAHNLWGPRASMARPWCASMAKRSLY